MATITPTFSPVGEDTLVVTWATMTTGNDTGVAVGFPEYSDRSVQMKGTLGAGGNVNIEGSNDGGTTWHVLNDPSSTAIGLSSLKTEQVMELTGLIRPKVSAGDGTTSLTVVMLLKRQRGGKGV